MDRITRLKCKREEKRARQARRVERALEEARAKGDRDSITILTRILSNYKGEVNLFAIVALVYVVFMLIVLWTIF